MSTPVTTTSPTSHATQQSGTPSPDSRNSIIRVAILSTSPHDLPVIRRLSEEADWCSCDRVDIPDTNLES
ncbi:MAG: hypothetical protein ABII12_13400, partial [Planctomycetota bacterium]